MKKQILEKLNEFKTEAEKSGLNVYAVALKGSQNYNLDDEESDIDANLVFIPTLSQIRSKKNYKITKEFGECTCHNIYEFADIVAKGNPQWIEICNTEYIIGDLSMFKEFKVNPSALKGMIMEKFVAFDKLYPSREVYVKKFGYDPKQLHHIIRLYDVLLNNVNNYQYPDGPERDYMMDIKRGRFPKTKEEAFLLRDEYIIKLNNLYESRKLSYVKQEIDYDLIDEIVIQSYMNR